MTLGKPIKRVSQNTTMLLDDFLVGYDKRLRPGFGGKQEHVHGNGDVAFVRKATLIPSQCSALGINE